MAEKRMISKVISVSEKVNLRLKDTFHMLLYTWLIPHADDFGRLTGSAAKVRALIVPMLDKTIGDVDNALTCLHDAELIIWYEVDGDKYIQIINFEEHQSGLHKRTKSKIPSPSEECSVIPGNSGNVQQIPLEQNRTELNGIEENRTGTEENSKSEILDTINRMNLKCKGLWELEQVTSYLETMEVDLILEAIKRSEKAQKVAYALGILKDWTENGFTRLGDLKPKGGSANAEHQRSTQGLQFGRDSPTSSNESITGGQTGWIGRKNRSTDDQV